MEQERVTVGRQFFFEGGFFWLECGLCLSNQDLFANPLVHVALSRGGGVIGVQSLWNALRYEVSSEDVLANAGQRFRWRPCTIATPSPSHT